jgi:hypothetical protein
VDDDRFSAVLSGPIEGLICVERTVRRGIKVPDVKENQQDMWIQQLLSDFAALNGELFGRGGSGGFVGEMRNGMKRMEDKQDRLQVQIGCLQKEMVENKVSTEDAILVLHGKADQAHARIDQIEPRVRAIEELGGLRAQKAITTVVKAAAVAIIGGAVSYFIF